ncbi:MAG: asparagine synthase (glutamine-hydrolyzing) [Thermodesulfobacteriota bacterium]
MCGINAIYRYTAVTESDRQAIGRMNLEMAYRGPDDDGLWSDSTVALGMRRLSIIGVANGRQPILNEHGDLVLVANGEIYNYKELRAGLASRGHSFATESDSESILHLYEEKGADCVRHLRGMFAFVLWDSRRRTLLAARDPVGEKPLYFAEVPTGVVFSSELKAISKHALTRREPQYNVIRQIMDYTYPVDMRHTVLKGVNRLLPGEYALVDPEGLRLHRYWKPCFQSTYGGSIEKAREDVLNLLKESVDLRFQSEVPVAVMLSGGIDSSAVAALSVLSGREVHAITVGYKGRPACDERRMAGSLAEERGIIWHEIELDEEDFEGFFDEYTAVLDEPVADPVCIPQWGIYKKSRELGFKVLLTGTGGDELFFGYPYHNLTALQRRARLDLERYLPLGDHNRKEFSETFSSGFYHFSRFGRYLFQDELDHFRPFKDYWKSAGIEWPDAMDCRSPDPLHTIAGDAENALDQVSAVLFATWLPANCLHISDKLGMGNSLEVRAPFLDHKLVELVFSLPAEWRFAKDNPKCFLKEILRGLVPEAILDAPKQGFTVPSRFMEHFVRTADRGLFRMRHRHFHTVLIEKVLSHHLKRGPAVESDQVEPLETSGPHVAGRKTIPIDEGIFRENLELVRNHHPEFFKTLMECAPEGTYRPIRSTSGRPSLLRLVQGEEPFLLHSLENPMKEAMELVKDQAFHGEDLTVLMGFGLGYLPLAIQERMHPDHRLFIMEACPEIFLKACEVMDLRSLLGSKGIRIFSTGHLEPLWDEFERERLRILAGRVNKLVHLPSRSLLPEAYREAEEAVEQFVAAHRESYHTLEAHLEKTVENVLVNLSSIQEATPADLLFGRLKGRPALVVAAGPSLDRNIGEIRNVRDRFFIISVDAALMPLLAEGITPDLVVSVDPNPLNLRKFASLSPGALEHVPLVLSPLVYHEIPKRFAGTKFVFGVDNRLSRWALGLCGNARSLPCGFTISHFAFYLARCMAADPIVFVGLDLAFSSDQDHAKNCAIHWDIDTARPDLPRIPGSQGGQVTTCDAFLRMITLFEREIARTEARCIDATEGGALLRGTEVMTFKDAADLVGREHRPLSAPDLHELWAMNHGNGNSSFQTGLAWLVNEASDLKTCCCPVVALFRHLDTIPGPRQGGTGLGEESIESINRVAHQVDGHREFLEIIQDQMGKVVVDQFRLQHQILRATDEDERLSLELRKSRLFFERLSRVADLIERLGRPLLERMESEEGHQGLES